MSTMVPGNSSFFCLFPLRQEKFSRSAPIRPSISSVHASNHRELRYPLETGFRRTFRLRCCSLFQGAPIAGEGREFRDGRRASLRLIDPRDVGVRPVHFKIQASAP